MSRCRFCIIVDPDDHRDDRELIYSDTYTAAFYDSFPSAPGHILIVPTRHVGRIWDMEPYEWKALTEAAFGLIAQQSADLTIGINDGPLSGQTIPHVHLHLIPRTAGDVPDPRGGIRWVIPQTAAYWDDPVTTPGRCANCGDPWTDHAGTEEPICRDDIPTGLLRSDGDSRTPVADRPVS